MKRTLASIVAIGFVSALIVSVDLTSASAQTAAAGSKTQTVAKAETSDGSIGKVDPFAKTDSAAKLQPVVKVTAPKTPASDSILPPPDGAELAESCKAEAEGFDAGYCLGVVEGVMASMKLCKRDRTVITLGEAADTMAKYLANHPEKLKQPDVIVARKALSEAYSCAGLRR